GNPECGNAGPSDAATDGCFIPPDGGAPQNDAEGEASTAYIRCDMTLCTYTATAPQVCCWDSAIIVSTCKTLAQCTGELLFPFLCKSSIDCAAEGKPGTVCCAGFLDNASSQVLGATCAQSCSNPALCNPTADECTKFDAGDASLSCLPYAR